MQFFIHKPPRKPGIEGNQNYSALVVFKTRSTNQILQGYFSSGSNEYECSHNEEVFHESRVEWWCYKDSLISHLESEE